MRWPFSLHLKHALVLARCFSFLEGFVLFLGCMGHVDPFCPMFDFLTCTRLFLLDWPYWGAEVVRFETFSSFFTMSSQLSWEGCTWPLLFNLIISIFSSSTYRLSWSFSSAIRSSQVSVITCSTQEFIAWEQHDLSQDNIIWTCEHVHVCERGW